MDIVLRAAVMFGFLFLVLRLMGKREIGQLTPFELVVMVAMGDLIQQGVTHNDFSLTGAMLAIGTFALLAMFLSWATFVSPLAERWFDGTPSVIARHGELLRDNMRRDRITVSEFESEMRLAGIVSLAEVEWAVLEPQGKISFICRDPSRPTETRGTDEKST
jgi:uncharacterized membrane protein YcaP (DUF421 family)